MSEFWNPEWETKRIGELCDVIDPHPSHRAPEEKQDGIFFLGIGDLSEDGQIIGSKARRVSPDIFFEHQQYYQITGNTIGFCRVASVGKVIEFKEEYPEAITISPTLAVIEPRDIEKKFLAYCLRSRGISEQVASLSSGSTRESLGIKILRDLIIPIPPLPEQKKIAEILSGIDRFISILGKREQSSRNLLEGAISEMFSIVLGVAEERRLCDIVNPDRPITYGIVQTGEKLLEGIPCVRVADFDSGTLDPSTMIKTSHEISSQYERTILQQGDLMVALRGDIGRTEIASGVLAGANLTRGVALLSKSYGVNPQYLRYAMRSPSVRRQIKDGTNGSALQEIPLKNLREILIPLPSLPQQVAHAVFLESIEVLITSTLSQRRLLELSKCALSSDLLSGRKRVSI